jgi:hypothetical protein
MNSAFCAWLLQVRQLVLDPAIQQEFGRLRRELEEQRGTISQLKEQNDSLTFTAVRSCCYVATADAAARVCCVALGLKSGYMWVQSPPASSKSRTTASHSQR